MIRIFFAGLVVLFSANILAEETVKGPTGVTPTTAPERSVSSVLSLIADHVYEHDEKGKLHKTFKTDANGKAVMHFDFKRRTQANCRGDWPATAREENGKVVATAPVPPGKVGSLCADNHTDRTYVFEVVEGGRILRSSAGDFVRR